MTVNYARYLKDEDTSIVITGEDLIQFNLKLHKSLFLLDDVINDESAYGVEEIKGYLTDVVKYWMDNVRGIATLNKHANIDTMISIFEQQTIMISQQIPGTESSIHKDYKTAQDNLLLHLLANYTQYINIILNYILLICVRYDFHLEELMGRYV